MDATFERMLRPLKTNQDYTRRITPLNCLGMKRKYYLLILLAFPLLQSRCTKEPEPETEGMLRLAPRAYFNEMPLEIGTSYTDVLGHTVRVDGFKTYISEVFAVKTDGSEVPLLGIDLINFLDAPTYNWTIERGDYQGIKFAMGVPEELNKDQDPAQYPSNHPLSVNGSAGMFWTWNSGYIFTKFEGKANLDGEADPILAPWAYHVGEDFLYQEHFIEKPFTIGEATEVLYLDFDADRFFYNDSDTINIAEDNITHTSGNVELAERFNTLFNEAISLN